MKQKILLLTVMLLCITGINAQENRNKEKNITGYAITAAEKGQRGWSEVRLMDITSGEELQTIYKGNQEIEVLNARTGKPVVKKDAEYNTPVARKIVNLDNELNRGYYSRDVHPMHKMETDRPFATNSAAMAYDKKIGRAHV